MSIATTDKINSLWRKDIDPLKKRMTDAETDLTGLHNVATQTADGLMSAEDKIRVDNYANIVEIAVSLKANAWVVSSSGTYYTQEVEVENFNVYNSCSVSVPTNVTTSQVNAFKAANISIKENDAGTGLVFYVTGVKPDINLPVVIAFGASMNVIEAPRIIRSDEGGGAGGYYGVSGTEGAAGVKVVSTLEGDFELVDGASILIKFENTDTAGSVSLNVDGTGIKSVTLKGEALEAGQIEAGGVYEFVFNGTNYEVVSSGQLGLTLTAEGISYDNSDTGLTAENTQDAIDEIIGNLLNVEYDAVNHTLIVPDSLINYDESTHTVTFLI